MPNKYGEPLEADVRDKSIRLAKRWQVFHKRMHFGYGAAGGWPDDLFVMAYAHHWWVEFKRPGGTASELQLKTHAIMRDQGMDVSVIDTFEQFDIEFNKRLSPRRREV